jgi:hypothetical protein
MKKSNIFVHIELSKLVEKLSPNVSLAKENLRAQAGYFNIIPVKYFSDLLSEEWEQILKEVKRKGPRTDQNGRVLTNAVVNTIDQMSAQESIELVVRIMSLHEKVKAEFD